MTDPLFARSLLAVSENQEVREQRRSLRAQFDSEREQLRVSVYESASLRSEVKARRDNEA